MSGKEIKKVKFGVISASGMAMAHAWSIKTNKAAELKAICDIDWEKAENAASELGIKNSYSDYRDLLKDEDIDAVVIATPDPVHAEQTIAALEAGKHVLCEKPMALILEECSDMIKASERTGKKLMIGQICRYTPGFMLAKEMIDKGEIGELFFVESEYAHDYTNIAGVGNWRVDPVKLRHPFLGGACHAVDLLRWIAGNPNEVTAYSNRKVLKNRPVDDCMISIMKFPNDVIGKVFMSAACKRNYTMRSVFYGDKGTIIVDNTSPYMTVYKQKLCERGRMYDKFEDQSIGVAYPININNHNTSGEINEFVDIILNNKPVVTDGIQGASTVAVCIAAIESAAIGQPVEIKYDLL